jgi:predicted transcriptional regulator YdeE
MNYGIVNLKEKKVVGLCKKTINQDMQAVSDIAALWQKFMGGGAYTSVQDKADGVTIGLYTDYEGDFTKPYNFLTCCEVTGTAEVKEPLLVKTIPAGKYAKFTTTGDVQQAVGQLWQEIWSMNLDRKYSSDFEVYTSDDMENQKVDIYISLN